MYSNAKSENKQNGLIFADKIDITRKVKMNWGWKTLQKVVN